MKKEWREGVIFWIENEKTRTVNDRNEGNKEGERSWWKKKRKIIIEEEQKRKTERKTYWILLSNMSSFLSSK